MKEKDRNTAFCECVNPGDARVRMLLGRQKPPGEGERLRRSVFTHILYADGKYLAFHTLTRRLLALEPRCVDLMTSERSFPRSCLAREEAAKLYEDYFLVGENAPESQTYLELKEILSLKEERPDAVTQFVILPTTACNARCFYCFEQGMQYRHMGEETLRDTLKFILEHSPKEKRIHIHWFGGEPLCAPENIDRICAGLSARGIAFTAEMTTNGSLFTGELARKAADEWKIGKVQITLDGLAEEYARRKRYAPGTDAPFETVIRNMHLLIAAGIRVTVRLNTDEDNVGEIYRTVDYLSAEFGPEERAKMHVYAHSLYGTGETAASCPAGVGKDALEERVIEICDYIALKGLAAIDYGEMFRLKSHYCMAAAPENCVLIDAGGKLFTCDAMPEELCIGDVENGIDPQALRRACGPCSVRDECARCAFLPQCTEFDRCPNRMPYDACRRQEKRLTERDMRMAYALWHGREAAVRREEAARVPD